MTATRRIYKRVLVICERHDTARRIAGTLAAARCTPLTTTTAPMGLLMAIDNRPDVIVCEPSLRGLSGAPLLALLRHHPLAGRIPVVAIGGLARAGVVTLPAEFGDEELLQAVEEAAELAREHA